MDDQIMIASEGCDATILNMLTLKRQLHSGTFERGIFADRDGIQMLMGMASWVVDMIAWTYDTTADLVPRREAPPNVIDGDADSPF